MGVPNGAPEASGRGVRLRKPKVADGFVVEVPIRKTGTPRRLPSRPVSARSSAARARPLTCTFDSSVLPLDEASAHVYRNGLPKPLKTGCWSVEEDEVLAEAVSEKGEGGWSNIALSLPGRIGKQCRERWHNHLKPNINKAPWTEQEDLAIQLGVLKHGHKWSKIAQTMPGRTDNQIKNRYNCTVQKYGAEKYQSSGMDTAAFLDELKRRNARTELEAVPLMRLANPRFLLNQSWTAEEIGRLQNAMSDSQADSNGCGADWATVAFLVGNRTPPACRAQWSRMCEAWTCKEHELAISVPPGVTEDAEPITVESVSALTMLTDEDASVAIPTSNPNPSEEDAFVSAAGEAAWNEIKLMCFEEFNEGNDDIDAQWTRSYQWDVQQGSVRKAVSFNFKQPSRPLKLALHMYDVRRHLIPKYHTEKPGIPGAKMSSTARGCVPGADPKMTDYYKETKRQLEEEEALVKSVLA